MMFFAWRSIVCTVPANREKPLEFDELLKLMQDLNTVYINIRGVLDNLAWALLHEVAPECAFEIRDLQVGLFKPCIVKKARFVSIADEIQKHCEWNRELKNRRDPSAHRIPLTVVPQIVNAHQATALSDLHSETWKAIGEGQHEAAHDMIREQEQIGIFRPLFWHDPSEAPIPIYPTVSEDLRHMIELFHICTDFLTDWARKLRSQAIGAGQ